MDLSTLPLMPSMDLPPPVEVPVPTAQRPSFDTSTKRLPEREVLDGCFCPSCQELRERDRTAASMRQQYGSTPPPPIPMVRSNELPSGTSFYDSGAVAFSGAVTGRISASQPAMPAIRYQRPPMQSSRRIRGRYTRDTDANGTLAGGERWLDPADGVLYDNPTVVSRVNSGMTPRVDGTWANDNGRVWEAT